MLLKLMCVFWVCFINHRIVVSLFAFLMFLRKITTLEPAILNSLCQPPCRMGVYILFYCCQRHTNYQGALCSNFVWMACFLFPRSLSYNFCYNLDIWAQGQALRGSFVVISFFTILSKV